MTQINMYPQVGTCFPFLSRFSESKKYAYCFFRLNFHLYQALRKALFKPGAFFKGFLLPLCESGNCTLREATIIGM